MSLPEPRQLIDKILEGDITALSRAITLVESDRPEHLDIAARILEGVAHHTGGSFRLGITGVPGVGKSTFIDAFGVLALKEGRKVAVLAVDPTSHRSRGSILGDKTRMAALSSHPNAFIRPSPAGSTLGGVTRNTFETMLLCEAAGFDLVMVETVGVGQSEVAVKGITDFFLLLVLAGAGDELQGIKRGIMEMADAVAVTKADGDNLKAAKAARSEQARAMHLLRAPESGWTPRALCCSAVSGEGLGDIMKMLEEYRTFMGARLEQRRRSQRVDLAMLAFAEQAVSHISQRYHVKQRLEDLAAANSSPTAMARQLLAALGI